MYNGILRIQVPYEVLITGFTDDIAITVVARHKDEMVLLANETIYKNNEWIINAGLDLAAHKVEAVLISWCTNSETATLLVWAEIPLLLRAQ